MNSINTKKRERIIALEKLIIYHKDLYYKGIPEISDIEYDSLEEELRKLDSTNYALSLIGFNSDNSDNDSKGGKVSHAKKMLSLNKTYDLEELEEWREGNEVVSTFKMDGVSCSLIYENGKLILAKTRGDGSYGEDITAKVMWIQSIPKEIEIAFKSVEIRGELFCDQKKFMELSEEMERNKLDRPSSARNIVAGLMGRKDYLQLSRYLSFIAFDVINVDLKNEVEKFLLLKEFGFNTPNFKLLKRREEVERAILEAKKFMEEEESEFQIDGLVLTFNDLNVHQELGETTHHPRYKIAFKFKGETRVATIREITWSVSRNGILTPVAEIEPIELSGATISRVTLHNYGVVSAHKLKSGDKIEIIRSGEVIPKFLALVDSAAGDFSVPDVCSSCGSKVEVKEIRLLCSNANCPGKKQDQILNFIRNIGIEDLSEKRLQELIRKGLVKDIPDLYDLKVEDFLILDKVKDKLANKLFISIQKTTRVELITFLSALGIAGGAINKCEKVVKNGYNTLEKVMSLKVFDLEKLDSFAKKSAEDFVNSLMSKEKIVSELLVRGMEVLPYKLLNNNLNNSNNFIGKKFCITGALSEKRSDVESKIKDAGGIVQDSVSKNTDYLVTNETDGKSSKFKKAKELNREIINENKLYQLLGVK
ncbi:MAG: NAD-dependent DNA ligase LigA [Oligoflexia bacterium]|nr:NAD-dependent DNA ligase LigA [Oligoflexia bacterium]